MCERGLALSCARHTKSEASPVAGPQSVPFTSFDKMQFYPIHDGTIALETEAKIPII
jgi:hypothetical protein